MIFTHCSVVYHWCTLYTGCQLTESIMVNHMQRIKVLLWYRLIYAWNTIYIRLWTLLRTTQISRSQNHGFRFSHFTLTQHFVYDYYLIWCWNIWLFIIIFKWFYFVFVFEFLPFEMQRGIDTLLAHLICFESIRSLVDWNFQSVNLFSVFRIAIFD